MTHSERPRYFRGAFRAYLITFALAAVIILCDPVLPLPAGLSLGGFAGALTGGVVGASALPVALGTISGLIWVIFLKRPFARAYLTVSTVLLVVPWFVDRIARMLER